MPLSELAVRNAKAKEKSYKLTDAGGLYLYVTKTGARSWRLDYVFESKRKTLALGQYPVLGLADARKKRDEAKSALLDGIDPGAAKKKTADTVKPTFAILVDEYIDLMRHEDAAEVTITKTEWQLKRLAADLLPMAIADIKAFDVLKVLQHVEATGRLESARRLRSTISRVFNLAVRTLMRPLQADHRPHHKPL
jgi:hypothetical protein